MVWFNPFSPSIIIKALLTGHHTPYKWAIPENIHTIPRTAFWNSEGKGGFFELEIGRYGGIFTIGIPKAWGFLDLGFPQETDKSVFLEKADFMDF